MPIQQTPFTPVIQPHYNIQTTQGEFEAEHRRKLEQIAAEANAKMQQAALAASSAAAIKTAENDQKTYEAGLAQDKANADRNVERGKAQATYNQLQIANKNTLQQQGLTEARLSLQDKAAAERDKAAAERDKVAAVNMGLSSANNIEQNSLNRDKFNAEQTKQERQQDAKDKYFTLGQLGSYLQDSKLNDKGVADITGAKDHLAILGIPVDQINNASGIMAQTIDGKISIFGTDKEGKQTPFTVNDTPVSLNVNALKLMQEKAAIDAGIKQQKDNNRFTQYNQDITNPETGDVVGRTPMSFNTRTGEGTRIIDKQNGADPQSTQGVGDQTSKVMDALKAAGQTKAGDALNKANNANTSNIPPPQSLNGLDSVVAPLDKTSVAETGAAGLQQANDSVQAKNNAPADPVPTGSNYSQAAWDELTTENKARVRSVNGYESTAGNGLGNNVTASNNNGSAEFTSFFGGGGGGGDGGGAA